MNFKSDNYAGVCPEIMKAIEAANIGHAAAYGADDYSIRLKAKMAEIFEYDVTIFLTSTGTSANGLALSAITPSHGTIYCHSHAHINTDECGAPELFTGAKLNAIGGDASKIDVRLLEQKIVLDKDLRPHASKPSAISITQLTEGGTAYSLDELMAIKACAEKHELFFHIDGARFANALITIGCTPAQMTWKSGIDVLSFGATKNGAMMAEMVVFFNQKLALDFDYKHKRAGQLMSKTRFQAAQFLAYLENDLWLRNARHANTMAKRLAEILSTISSASINHDVQGNEIFVNMPDTIADILAQKGAHFYRWGENYYRFVTSWATSSDDMKMFEMMVGEFNRQKKG